MNFYSLLAVFLCLCMCVPAYFTGSNDTDLTKTIDTIQARRSVRIYDTDRKVDDSSLHSILDAAMCSPTACNAREYRFIVVRDIQTRMRLAQNLTMCKFISKPTAVAVIVVADLSKEICKGMWIQNCAAASQSMLLGATTLGIGSTWCAIHPYDSFIAAAHEILGIPEGIEPFSAVVFGYPPPDQPLVRRESRYNSTFIHVGHW